MDDAALVQAYLGELAQQRRQSAYTVRNYQRDLERLLALATEAGAAPLASLQDHHIRRFVGQLHGRGLSGRSIALALLDCDLVWDDRVAVEEAMRGHLDGRVPYFDAEYRVRHRDGRWLCVATHLSLIPQK